jgi:hypothetical protein
MSLLKELEDCFTDYNFGKLSVNDEYALFVIDNVTPRKLSELTSIAVSYGLEINVDTSLEFSGDGLEIELTKTEDMNLSGVNFDKMTFDVSIFKDTPNDMELGKKIRAIYNQQLEKSNGEENNTK